MGGWLVVAGVAFGLVGYAVFMGGTFERPTPGAIGRALSASTGLPGAAVFVAGALATVAGLALYVVVPGLNARLARRSFDQPRVILACLAAVFVLGNALTIPVVMAQPRAGQLTATGLVLAMLATQLALMAVLVWRIVRPGAITWEDMGLSGEHLDRRMTQGVVGGVAILFIALLVGALQNRIGVENTQIAQFGSIRGATPIQFLALWLAGAVSAPICEECFFRGYVFGALRGRYGRSAAYAGSALVFAAVHFNLSAIVPILAMALILAFLYDRSRSVVPGMVAHGFNNAVVFLIVYSGVVPQ